LYFIVSWEKGDSGLQLPADGAAPLWKSLYCHSPDWGNNPAPTEASTYFSFNSLQMRTDLFLLIEENSTRWHFIYPWISSLWCWAQRNYQLQIHFKAETSNTQKTVSSLLCPAGCDLTPFHVKDHCPVEMYISDIGLCPCQLLSKEDVRVCRECWSGEKQKFSGWHLERDSGV